MENDEDSPVETSVSAPEVSEGPSVIFVLAIFGLILSAHSATCPSVSYNLYATVPLVAKRTYATTVSFHYNSTATSPAFDMEEPGVNDTEGARVEQKTVSPTASVTKEASSEGHKVEPKGMTQAKFVIGISNGHQGTSFLGGEDRYANGKLQRKQVGFFFERKSDCVRAPCQRKFFKFCKPHKGALSLRYWYRSIKGDSALCRAVQDKLVENVCMPRWVRSKPEKVVVLGHDTLFYVYGLLPHLNQTHFIRLRRPRIETARSFTLSGKTSLDPVRQFEPVNDANCLFQVVSLKHEMHPHLNAYALCPLERSEDVVLKPPSMDVWRNLSYYQRALWFIDELEARWSLLLRHNPSIRYSEYAWSSRNPEKYGSMTQVHKSIAETVGLLPVNDGLAVKVHVKTEISDSGLENLYKSQDAEYQLRMGFDEDTKQLISKVQF